jgi:DNA-directed RNA polymerase subunit alpha|tara:strand:- start:456 stop:1394 length:939 start_codon:yes stop_codon:yes gene_type:complete
MFQIQCLNSKTEKATNLLAKFCIEPLKKGQGITVGNALRRVLLSDLPGIAIIGVRINNVNHEFSTIPGLKEDVIEVLLNLKQIVFKGDLTESITARLRYQGPGIVTAKDIELPDGITLVEPCQYIASLTERSVFEMEVLIEPGYGYLTNERFINRLPKGFLATDAIFMPVRKVNFFVETLRTSSSSIAESLILEIITDGSIQPIEAIYSASSILENIFASFQVKDETIPTPPMVLEATETTNEYDNIMLEELELSVRAYNCLKRANVNNLSELLKYSQDDLLEFKNFGQKSADEVCESLKNRFGIVLPRLKN